MSAFGSLLLHNDLDVIFEINDKLNRAGMDSISAGGTVAFALECFQKGIFSTKDTDGMALDLGRLKIYPVAGGQDDRPRRHRQFTGRWRCPGRQRR